MNAVSLIDFRLGAEARQAVAEFPGGWRVVHDPMVHQPYGLFRIYRRGTYIAAQISFPDIAQCEWQGAQLRRKETPPSKFYAIPLKRRPGRPRKYPPLPEAA